MLALHPPAEVFMSRVKERALEVSTVALTITIELSARTRMTFFRAITAHAMDFVRRYSVPNLRCRNSNNEDSER